MDHLTMPTPVQQHNRSKQQELRARYGDQFEAGMRGLLSELGRRPTGKEREVIKAYVMVLHRVPDLVGLAEYSKYDSTSTMAKILATSNEAAQRGVDPTAYGSTLVNPGSLPADLNPYYNEWRLAVGPGVPLTDTVVEQLRWFQDAGDPRFMRASLNGEIQQQATMSDGGIQSFSIVTPAAIKTMGGSYTGIGNDPGDTVLLPAGAGPAEGDEWMEGDTVTWSDGQKYQVLGAKGHQTNGLLGEIGIESDDLPDWVAPVVDTMTLNLGSSILGGGELHEDSSKFYGDTFGKDFERWYNNVNLAVVAAVDYSVGTRGVATAAFQGLQGTALHAQGLDVDMGDVWTGAALSAATAGASAPVQAASAAASTKLTGGDWGDAAASAGWSLFGDAARAGTGSNFGGSLVTNVVRTSVDGGDWDQAMFNIARDWGMGQAGSKMKPEGTVGERLIAWGKGLGDLGEGMGPASNAGTPLSPRTPRSGWVWRNTWPRGTTASSAAPAAKK